MQNLKAIAIAAVMVFGIGGAVVANQLAEEPANVMNTAEEGQPEHWVTLTDNNGCDGSTFRRCTGYQATIGGTVLSRENGNKL